MSMFLIAFTVCCAEKMIMLFEKLAQVWNKDHVTIALIKDLAMGLIYRSLFK